MKWVLGVIVGIAIAVAAVVYFGYEGDIDEFLAEIRGDSEPTAPPTDPALTPDLAAAVPSDLALTPSLADAILSDPALTPDMADAILSASELTPAMAETVIRAQDLLLAVHHAPIHYQDTQCLDADAEDCGPENNHRVDYITRFDFDENMVATDNWDHAIGHGFPLEAFAYYSVVESGTHWYIVYMFFHPRDWTAAELGENEYENDAEGLLAIVRRDGTQYGRLDGVIVASGNQLTPFATPRSELEIQRPTSMFQRLGARLIEEHDGVQHFATCQATQDHALSLWPNFGGCDSFWDDPNRDGIINYPSADNAEEPRNGLDRHVTYQLIDIATLWERQIAEDLADRSQAETYAKFGRFLGDRSGDCGNTMKPCVGNAGVAPWGWDDEDDGPSFPGEIAFDPGRLAAHYFTGFDACSDRYIRNRYLTDLRSHDYDVTTATGRNPPPLGWPRQLDLAAMYERLTADCQ